MNKKINPINAKDNFLKENPEIKKALKIFDIAYKQYKKTLEGEYSYFTSTTTAPADTDYLK